MRAIERGVDLDAIEDQRVTLQVAVALGEAACVDSRNRPAGAADVHGGHGRRSGVSW